MLVITSPLCNPAREAGLEGLVSSSTNTPWPSAILFKRAICGEISCGLMPRNPRRTLPSVTS